MRRAGFAIFIIIMVGLAGCGRSEDPTARLRAEVRRNPDSVEARVALGDACMESGAHHDAFVQYAAAAERDSQSFEAHYGLARAQEALADTEAAMKSVNQALALKQDAPDAVALKGALLLQSDQAAEAAVVLEEARAVAPDNEVVHTYLPAAYIALEDLGKAESAARDALKHMPGSPQAHLTLALVLVGREKPDEAEAVLRQGMEVAPEDPLLPLRLAELLAMQGKKLEEAVQLADRSVELERGDGSADLIAAMALRRLGREDGAISRLRDAATAHPRNPRLWMTLAAVHRAAGDEEEAARAAAMAFRVAPRRRVRTAPADGEEVAGTAEVPTVPGSAG